MSDITVLPDDLDPVFQRIRAIWTNARHRAMQAVNAEMGRAYWEIGREIVEEEQQGKSRAEYGAAIIPVLAKRLTAEFGKGFTENNLWYIRQFH